MGNDMIMGKSCSYCGVYFEHAHGYAVVCKDCWSECSKKERENCQIATNKEL